MAKQAVNKFKIGDVVFVLNKEGKVVSFTVSSIVNNGGWMYAPKVSEYFDDDQFYKESALFVTKEALLKSL